MKSASKDDNARSIRNRVSTQGYYCQTHYRMLQFLLLPMPDTVMQIFSSGSLAGNAQAWLQCHCSVKQAGTKGKRKVKRINFESRRRRGSPS